MKPKRYRQEFRTRFCEGLLARRILIAEGATEAASLPVVSRRLAELNPETYTSLEALGICTIDAGGETNIADLAKLYHDLGKRTFAVCDKQSDDQKASIEAQVEMLFMHEENGFENLVLRNTTEEAMKRFAQSVPWPAHILADYPDPQAQPCEALRTYFEWAKANWGIADFLAQCTEAEIPEWLHLTCLLLKVACDPEPATAAAVKAPVVETDESERSSDEAH